MIVNGLLCYVVHYMNSSPLTDIERIIFNFYDHDEVVDAKKELWQECKEHLDAYRGRQRTGTLTATTAHIQDIIAALKKLDGIGKTPEIYVKDLDCVPDRQPAEYNYATTLQNVADLKRFKADTEETLSTMAADILRLQNAQQAMTHNVTSVRQQTVTDNTNQNEQSDVDQSNDQVNVFDPVPVSDQ